MTIARDIMNPSPVTVGPEQSVFELVQLLYAVGSDAAAVLDGEALAGVITSAHLASPPDLALALIRRERPDVRVRERLVEVAPISPDLPATEVLALLYAGTAGCVPVADEDGGLAGLVTPRSVVAALASRPMTERVFK